MISDKLKNTIINKLYEDLSKLEVILFEDSIWLVDVEKKYWVLEYRPEGLLIYRYDFFNYFFVWYSLRVSESEPMIVDVFKKIIDINSIDGFLSPIDVMVGIHTWNGMMTNLLSNGVIKTEECHSKRSTKVNDILN
jgi:hypothetical protein